MPIINLIYNAPRSWKPSSNTIVYYNIDSNDTPTTIYDHSWNNNTLSWWNFTYVTDSSAWRVYQWWNYSTLPSTNIIDFWQTFTFIAWVKYSSSSPWTIFANGATSSTHPSNCLNYWGNSLMWWASWVNDSSRTVSYSSTIQTWVWLMIAYTRDSNGNLNLYQNNSQVATNTVSSSVVYPWWQFMLGWWRVGDVWPLNWYLKVLIWENKARTVDEITAYYNRSKENYWL